MVGRTMGRSISASTIDRPGNESRTSTQASTVPMTVLTTVTRAAATSVRVSADRASGAVTDAQKPEAPFSAELYTTAASGIRTSRLRYITAVPSPSAGARASLGDAAARRAAGCWSGPVGSAATSAAAGVNAVGSVRGVDTSYFFTDTPSSRSTSTSAPFCGSKNFVVTASQPPRSVMVNRPVGFGKSAPGTPLITGR